jgi:hypothetical protein
MKDDLKKNENGDELIFFEKLELGLQQKIEDDLPKKRKTT